MERCQWTLKADTLCYAEQHCTEALPRILLEIDVAFKEDLQASVAELIYGGLLALTADPVNPAYPITEFRQHMAHLRPIPATRHTSLATFMHSALEKCMHVFLCQDTMCWALDPPYSGTHQVLSWREKKMELLMSRQARHHVNWPGSSQPTC
jgi:hypothetical protein